MYRSASSLVFTAVSTTSGPVLSGYRLVELQCGQVAMIIDGLHLHFMVLPEQLIAALYQRLERQDALLEAQAKQIAALEVELREWKAGATGSTNRQRRCVRGAKPAKDQQETPCWTKEGALYNSGAHSQDGQRCSQPAWHHVGRLP